MDEKDKRSLRNEKFKANRASETEEQRKERLRIRRSIAQVGPGDRGRKKSKKWNLD